MYVSMTTEPILMEIWAQSTIGHLKSKAHGLKPLRTNIHQDRFNSH